MVQNIFPIAQKAFIEQTIGYSRPSAIPPTEQIAKESSFVYQKAPLFKYKPTWFKWDSLSEIERNFVKTLNTDEETYLKTRNIIIRQYEESQSYIPFNSILQLDTPYRITGRIFDFLEDQLIINFQNELSFRLEGLHYNVNINNNINDGEPNNSNNNNINDNNNNNNSNNSNNDIEVLFNKQNNINTNKRVVEKYIEKETLQNSHCNCGQKAFYFTSDLVFVCDSCFNLGKYPEIYSPRNFHKITDSLINSIWTKQEEYILLKNIEKVGDDWSRVCEGLNKTVEQCIFHFIKMSIIDDVVQFPTPFTQIPNPMSTLIAFICSIVYPSISTELAKNAILYLNNPNLIQILLGVAKEKSGEVLEIEKKKKRRLEEVEVEAMIKRMMLKVEAINEMNGEMQAIRNELEDERERMMEEGN